MLLADVNVFIHAHRPDTESSKEYAAWLTRALTGPEPFGVSSLVLSGFLRVVTNHRVFADPTPPDVALAFCEDVRSAPAAVMTLPGPRHWQIFRQLCEATGARGNVVPDAYLAALAIEHGATWISTDTGFARFPGLRWRRPLD